MRRYLPWLVLVLLVPSLPAGAELQAPTVTVEPGQVATVVGGYVDVVVTATGAHPLTVTDIGTVAGVTAVPVETSVTMRYTAAGIAAGSTVIQVVDSFGNVTVVDVPVVVSAAGGIEAGTLAYVGCSNTDDAVSGDPGPAFVPHYPTGGGTLPRWATDSRDHRAIFEANHTPGDPVWWNICIRQDEGINQDYPTHQSMIDEIASWLLPQSGTVWVSPLNLYDPSVSYPPKLSTVVFHAEMVQYAVDTYGLEYGPVLGPLTADMLKSDGTHPNSVGIAFLGGQLDGFFTPLIGG